MPVATPLRDTHRTWGAAHRAPKVKWFSTKYFFWLALFLAPPALTAGELSSEQSRVAWMPPRMRFLSISFAHAGCGTHCSSVSGAQYWSILVLACTVSLSCQSSCTTLVYGPAHCCLRTCTYIIDIVDKRDAERWARLTRTTTSYIGWGTGCWHHAALTYFSDLKPQLDLSSLVLITPSPPVAVSARLYPQG